MASKNAPATVEPKVGEIAPLAPPSVASMFEEVGLSDIVIPKVYLMADLSDFVKNGQAKPGDLVLATGPSDPAPVHLVGGDADDSVVMYVLGREKFAATTSSGFMEFHPDKKRDPNDSDSWEGWFFDVAVPDFEDTIPVRWMVWKTAGTPAAKAINTLLEKQFHTGNYEPLAIRVSTGTKTNRKGQTYYVPRVAPAEPTDEGLAVARRLRDIAVNLRQNRATENTPPDVQIDDQPSFS
ncbi:MAG: hypothetical protein OJJ55_18990 [Rhodococcus sp.]|nr:hypothetical protein [Rhodococcus sp. (in: high G+C Gram-positive bacteria)]